MRSPEPPTATERMETGPANSSSSGRAEARRSTWRWADKE